MSESEASEREKVIMEDDWDHPRFRRRGSSLCTRRRLCSLAWITGAAALVVAACLYLQVFRGFDERSRLGPSSKPTPPTPPRWPVRENQFVSVYEGDFVLVEDLAAGAEGEAANATTAPRKDCQSLYLTGWNAWDITRAARISPRNHKTRGGLTGEEAVRLQFQEANALGLNVVRAWAHTVDPAYRVMVSPGLYDEAGLEAIDYVLHQARESGVRVILSFVDNWKYHGGVDEMVDFSETAPERTSERPTDESGDFDQVSLNETVKEYEVRRHALFFTDEGSREVYKSHVRELLNRRNAYSGVLYRDDPTVFAWNLINEPRCESWLVEGCEASLQEWIEEMSLYVKKLDPNHLVTVGGEGFFAGPSKDGSAPEGALDGIEAANPAGWAAQTGQDFVANHLPETIDFATIHLWPDNWNQSSRGFQENWINKHVEVAREVLKKPVIVQEFGKKLPGGSAAQGRDLSERDQVYEMVNGIVESNVADGGALKGSLFWNWELDLMVGAADDPYTLQTTDSTFGLVESHGLRMHNLSASSIYSCDDFERHPQY
ncbi:glycoside hydrolase [Chloropicon primus]|uniref:mannan endo-1,4-beta-mannosidase n=1 Tax=Chloropicon primus TaxID=1764295 RepID=A0A5B8MNJ0_9CHLO|nr:glycoside hydrolase [Chloropicon primus]UPR01187.1 glycoside hydrolase [Chloropicon primus]|eukprot:QDZ21967.1 glycoside hydrolase [Chloropicon primus]